jgi:hypothetical protein
MVLITRGCFNLGCEVVILLDGRDLWHTPRYSFALLAAVGHILAWVQDQR